MNGASEILCAVTGSPLPVNLSRPRLRQFDGAAPRSEFDGAAPGSGFREPRGRQPVEALFVCAG